MSEDTDDAQKTEDPTGKKLDDAREQGNVSRSQEFNHLFMITAFTFSVILFSAIVARGIVSISMPFVASPDQIPTDLNHLIDAAWHMLGYILLAGIGPMVLALMAAFGSSYFQFGLLWSTANLEPKLSKISPIKGLGRMFSLRSVTELMKGVLKLCIIAVIIGYLVMPSVGELHKLVGMEIVQLLAVIRDKVYIVLVSVVVIMAVVAVADMLYQRYEYIKGLRMSRQELKDEYKQTEGDPLVKGRLRQLRMERARRRMMGEVPKADVVVTNPTHFAVALKYAQFEMSAPKVVAKGADKTALRIREVAKAADVPIVENPPLARGLFAAVELDQEIPAEYYKAVAELISYVYKLKKTKF